MSLGVSTIWQPLTEQPSSGGGGKRGRARIKNILATGGDQTSNRICENKAQIKNDILMQVLVEECCRMFWYGTVREI